MFGKGLTKGGKETLNMTENTWNQNFSFFGLPQSYSSQLQKIKYNAYSNMKVVAFSPFPHNAYYPSHEKIKCLVHVYSSHLQMHQLVQV